MINLTETDTFAIFKMPDDNTIYFVRQFLPSDNNFKESSLKKSGFVIYPFDIESNKAIFINADEILIDPFFNITITKNTELQSTTIEEYTDISKKIIAVLDDKYYKIVHSKIKVLKNEGADIYKLYKRLAKKNKNAFVFLFNTPETGLWMGATPEKLLTAKNNKFETIALAGTQYINANSEVTWNEKDISEQKIVMEYLENILKESDIEFKKNGPYTKIASRNENMNLVHLATDYKFSTEKTLYNLLLKLHPTPAT
ncbi:MAG: chorismate-binding protein [Saprospiraceae bacterium]